MAKKWPESVVKWPTHRFVCFFTIRLETLQSTSLKLFEQKKFLSNCSKQLVTPVNLTRIFFLTNYLISRIGSELPKLKTAFYESHFPHCVFQRLMSSLLWALESLKSFLEWKVLGAFSSGLGLNSFESCYFYSSN